MFHSSGCCSAKSATFALLANVTPPGPPLHFHLWLGHSYTLLPLLSSPQNWTKGSTYFMTNLGSYVAWYFQQKRLQGLLPKDPANRQYPVRSLCSSTLWPDTRLSPQSVCFFVPAFFLGGGGLTFTASSWASDFSLSLFPLLDSFLISFWYLFAFSFSLDLLDFFSVSLLFLSWSFPSYSPSSSSFSIPFHHTHPPTPALLKIPIPW